jgi:hypothetical protein
MALRMSPGILVLLVGCCVPLTTLATDKAPVHLEAQSAALGIPYHR